MHTAIIQTPRFLNNTVKWVLFDVFWGQYCATMLIQSNRQKKLPTVTGVEKKKILHIIYEFTFKMDQYVDVLSHKNNRCMGKPHFSIIRSWSDCFIALTVVMMIYCLLFLIYLYFYTKSPAGLPLVHIPYSLAWLFIGLAIKSQKHKLLPQPLHLRGVIIKFFRCCF